MAVEIEQHRRLFTADEFERMVAAGIFEPKERLELIRGEIVAMSPIGHRHGASVANLNKRLVIGVGDRAVVWIQSSVRVAFDSIPEPDLALLHPRSYVAAGPRPTEIFLVVEVAESSLRYDRGEKLALYAEAGIPEYWVVSVENGWIDVCRAPEGSDYRDRRRVMRNERVSPLAFADISILVADVFA